MYEESSPQVGNGIVRPSARPIKIYVDDDGEYWICDKNVYPASGDFAGQGCVAHSDVHLVK